MTNLKNAIKRCYKSKLKKRYGALNSDKFYLAPWLRCLINKIELVILGLNQYQNFRNKKKIVNEFKNPLLFLPVDGENY